MSRALVLGPGGLRGAYGGGVVATLGRKLGCNYFDALYTCSAGSYTGSYLASGQPDMIEAIWRECVHGTLLMRWRNIFRADQPILDLFYLNNVLRSEAYKLSVKDVLQSPVKMFMVATERKSGVAHYFSPKTSEEFFLQVRASAAVPYLHPRVLINGKEYVDGHLSDPFPIERALTDGHDEVIVVCNQSRQSIASLLEANTKRVRAIFPSTKSPVRWNFDSSKTRINQLVDLGIADALTFLA
jgi:predicted patatin/cPLA2 family phospholipase